AQHIWPMDLLHSKSLQRTEVIDVSQFAPQFFKDLPIPIASDRAICLLQVPFEISLYPIVVEERVVNVIRNTTAGVLGIAISCQLLLSNSFAISVTRSGSNRYFRSSSFSGADAPNVFIPMMRPELLPT